MRTVHTVISGILFQLSATVLAKELGATGSRATGSALMRRANGALEDTTISMGRHALIRD